MAASYAVTLTRGEDLSLSLTWLIDDVAVDLTATSAVFWVDGQSGPLLSAPVTLGGSDGTLAVAIPNGELVAAIRGQGGGLSYRLMVTMPATSCLLKGSLAVSV